MYYHVYYALSANISWDIQKQDRYIFAPIKTARNMNTFINSAMTRPGYVLKNTTETKNKTMEIITQLILIGLLVGFLWVYLASFID